jgi:hypothetical protein
MTQSAIPTLAAAGAHIPIIGFGTSQLGDCAEIVATALRLGYRHIDTAWKYGSEKGVGAGIKASGVPREGNLSRHQGFARKPARRRFRALGRREPAQSSGRLRRSACISTGRPSIKFR